MYRRKWKKKGVWRFILTVVHKCFCCQIYYSTFQATSVEIWDRNALCFKCVWQISFIYAFSRQVRLSCEIVNDVQQSCKFAEGFLTKVHTIEIDLSFHVLTNFQIRHLVDDLTCFCENFDNAFSREISWCEVYVREQISLNEDSSIDYNIDDQSLCDCLKSKRFDIHRDWLVEWLNMMR
jgi:hypothetical protein